MANTYNLFISHSWTYSDAYDRLINLLDERKYFSYRDYSVPKDDPIHNAPNSRALEDAIKRQMSPCHVVLIMAGVYSSYSTWIKKEIDIAVNSFSTEKPILAIKPWGNTNISQVVFNNADDIVNWNTESIVQGIRNLI